MDVTKSAVPLSKFVQFAELYALRGITVVPLGRNEEGRVKVPLTRSYARLQPSNNVQHDWSRADGLGIVLGPPSGNLAAIDVDDSGLAEFLEHNLTDREGTPLMSGTPRPGLHIWCLEPTATRPVDLEVNYQGRRCLVQILGAACQAAVPPTEGYRWLNTNEPFYATAGAAWNRIAKDLGLYYRAASPYSFLRRERSRGPTTAEVREAASW